MTKPMLIRQSPLTGQWYAFTAYRQEGKALVVTGKKWDVTEQINAIIQAAKQPPVDICLDEQGHQDIGWEASHDHQD